MHFDPKTELWRPRIDLFSHFGRFVVVPKIIEFLTSRGSAQKSLKINP